MKQNLAETRSIGDAFFIVQSFRALERVRLFPSENSMRGRHAVTIIV
jgi:hypothetical protein